ncbi:MAG: NINE protein [Micrococcales bacterium]|nr:NINE protein [Micrococcales bacterium]NBR61987.1 NINE protein [Actinomycetota bacterium]NBR55245.1 NINE protein [Micrococcales bacterium]NBT48031.1 NINE protein [Actinomycetota bacterium]NBY44079.1 NINE protein [Micrococcales bacterium]
MSSASDKFCSACGNGLIATAAICPKCGTPVAANGYVQGAAGNDPNGPRDFMTTLLLSIFVGTLGIDRFYTGQTGLGIGKLLVTVFTCGYGGFVWWLIDVVLIVNGSYRDKQGRPLVRR